MTDRDLLELAAKASGMNIAAWERSDSGFWCYAGLHDDTIKTWNPLTDDGDALRLAVKLGMRLCIDNRVGFSWVKGVEGSVPHDGNANAATRRAIVRAAAAALADAGGRDE